MNPISLEAFSKCREVCNEDYDEITKATSP